MPCGYGSVHGCEARENFCEDILSGELRKEVKLGLGLKLQVSILGDIWS